MSRELTPEEARQVAYVVAVIFDAVLQLAEGKDDDEIVFIGSFMEQVARMCHRPETADDFDPITAGELRARYRRAMAAL
jgi:hypothetical protein